MNIARHLPHALAAFAAALLAGLAEAQTVKIGIIGTYSGPNAQHGENIERGLRLYMKRNAERLPPGVKDPWKALNPGP